MDIVCVSSVANDLGECVYWDVRARRLCWIDAWKTEIHTLDPASGETRCIDLWDALSGLPIGSIAHHKAGGMVAGVKGGFYRLKPERRTARLIAAVEVEAARQAQPLAGHVFAIRGVGSRGIPEPRFCE